MVMKNNLKNFVIDIGDTLGGILLGLSLDAHSNLMLIFGSLLIVFSVYFKYLNNNKEPVEGQKFTMAEVIEHLKDIR